MVEGDQKNQDTGASSDPTLTTTGKKKSAYGEPRPFTEKELSSPAAVQFHLRIIEQLNEEVTELRSYRDRFHEVDKANAVLEHRLRAAGSRNAIFDLCLAVGTAFMGLSPGIWEKSLLYGVILLFTGMILTVSSGVAKVMKS